MKHGYTENYTTLLRENKERLNEWGGACHVPERPESSLLSEGQSSVMWPISSAQSQSQSHRRSILALMWRPKEWQRGKKSWARLARLSAWPAGRPRTGAVRFRVAWAAWRRITAVRSWDCPGQSTFNPGIWEAREKLSPFDRYCQNNWIPMSEKKKKKRHPKQKLIWKPERRGAEKEALEHLPEQSGPRAECRRRNSQEKISIRLKKKKKKKKTLSTH